MSPLLWLQRLFVPQDEPDDPNSIPDLEDEQPFVFSQHFRIVLAIFVTFISALVIWWIMA